MLEIKIRIIYHVIVLGFLIFFGFSLNSDLSSLENFDLICFHGVGQYFDFNAFPNGIVTLGSKGDTIGFCDDKGNSVNPITEMKNAFNEIHYFEFAIIAYVALTAIVETWLSKKKNISQKVNNSNNTEKPDKEVGTHFKQENIEKNSDISKGVKLDQ